MSSYTTIYSKESVSTPDHISFGEYDGLYYYSFDSELWEMQDMLDTCKESKGITAKMLPWLEPVLEIIEEFKIQNYIIDYVNDFAGMPDDNCFTIPVLKGIVISEYIVDATNWDNAAIKAAYNAAKLKSI